MRSLRRVVPRRRKARRPQLERDTPIVVQAVAVAIMEELALHLGVTLPRKFVAGLTFRAHRCYAHSASFREKMARPGDRGRDLLYLFMRHWLADRLRVERPAWFARLPAGFAIGEPFDCEKRRG